MTEDKSIPKEVEEALAQPVDDFFFHLADYFYRKRKVLISFGLGLLVLLVGFLGWREWVSAQEIARNVALYQIEKGLTDPNLDFKTKNDRALDRLAVFAKTYPNTAQVHMARFMRANLFAGQGQYLKAQMELEILIASIEGDTGFKRIAQVVLANLLRDQGKVDEAISFLEAVQGSVMRDAILLELAEAYLKVKKSKEAKATLDELLKDYPDSLYKHRAQQLLPLVSP